MAEGAPDYAHLRVIQGKDVDGNLVIVRVDPYGRIILLPYGTMLVEGELDVNQTAVERTIQGADGLTLHTIAVDDQGRLIMLPYGWDGSAYQKLRVDEDGRMVAVMKGKADVTWDIRGWWKFVGSEGAKIKDYSGYGHHGNSILGGVAGAVYHNGVVNQCLEFSGTNDYVSVPDADTLDLIKAFTIEAWIRPDTVAEAEQGIIEKDGAFVVRLALTHLKSFIKSNASWYDSESDYTFVVDTWYHVVVTFDIDGDSKMHHYINGTEPSYVSQDVVPGDIAVSALNLFIGAVRANAGCFNGEIDEARLYSRQLSLEEIQWRYEHTDPTRAKPTRMVAVDNEGRMLVNIEGLPYKDQVLISEHEQSPSGPSTVKVYSDPVPEGKI